MILRGYKLHWLAMIALAILCLPILTGCSATPLIELRTVEVPVERFIPVPATLTESLSPPDIPAAVMTWSEIAGLGLEYRSRWLSCEIDRLAIRGLGNE